MPLYMYEGAYTPESLAAQIREPRDRIEVVKPAFDAIGAKILAAGYPFGQYDVIVVYEAPNDTAAASLALAVAAGGAVKAAKTTKLLSGQEWIASLTGAQKVAPQYRPAR
ncbi:MAG: GYD domain-containing protein [Chloroflexi bacterium]|nr:MAG: GYD domain-containing protein [Chloroflexota bacterium]